MSIISVLNASENRKFGFDNFGTTAKDQDPCMKG